MTVFGIPCSFEIENKAINLYMGHTGDLLNGVNDNGSCDTLINTDINSEFP